MAYRIVPIKTDEPEQGEYGMIDPYVMYDNMMNKFKWGNAADPKVYLDENNRRMFSNFRRLFGNLGKALLNAGDTTKALEVVRRGLELVPAEKLPNDYFSLGFAEDMILAGKKDEGLKLLDSILGYSKEYLEFVVGLRADERYGLELPTGINMQVILDAYRMSIDLKLESLSAVTEQMINNYYGKLYNRK
jgi:tetratricopeptide (TPR) repeat protein